VRGFPAVANGEVYAVDLDDRLYAFSAIDGSCHLSVEGVGVTTADGISPLLRDGTLCTHNYRLQARDSTDGGVEWGTDKYYI
jgi:hypothetical protein